jgi:hypothetical protein
MPPHEHAALVAQAEAEWAAGREANNRKQALLHDPVREPIRQSAAANQPQQQETEPAAQSTDQTRVDSGTRLEQADNKSQEKHGQPKLSR